MSIRSFNQKRPEIKSSAYVDPSADVIGDVVMGEDCSVWPQAVIRADVHGIRIGDRSNIQDNAVLHVTHDSIYQPGGFALQIGDDVTVGHGAILHGCQIGDGCLIGMGSIIMDGAVLEPGMMLAAGSLVTPGKRLSGAFLWVGSPARQSRRLTDKEQEYLLYSAAHYVKLKNQYL